MATCKKHLCELEEKAPKLEEYLNGIYDIIYVCPICRQERMRFLASVARRMRKMIGRNITIEISQSGNHKGYFYSGTLENVGDLVSSVIISGRFFVSFIDQEGLSPENMEMADACEPNRRQIIAIRSEKIFLYKKI